MATPTIKFKQSSIPSDAVPSPVVTKAGRHMKPTEKAAELQRSYLDEDDDDAAPARPAAAAARKPKTPAGGAPMAPKIKLKMGASDVRTPIVFKTTGGRGRPPVKPKGEGYDSEASDREEDPTIEENIIFRMLPGPDLDYLQTALGNHKKAPDVKMRFLDDKGARVLVTVRGNHYVATLTELPTITEAMKTFDRKAIIKTADVCNMLLVFARVSSEDEARKAPLPPLLAGGTNEWPHGLTPPMHDARHRRFRKMISKKEIENKEAEVARLLDLDRQAESSTWSWIDDRVGTTATPAPFGAGGASAAEAAGLGGDADGDEDYDAMDYDAEGEQADYFSQPVDAQRPQPDAADMLDLEAEIFQAFGEDHEMADAAAAGTAAQTAGPGETPALPTTTGTPAAGMTTGAEDEEEEDDEDEDESDDSGDDDAGGAGDDEERQKRQHQKALREDVAELYKSLLDKEKQIKEATNHIFRERFRKGKQAILSQLNLKRVAMGLSQDEFDNLCQSLA